MSRSIMNPHNSVGNSFVLVLVTRERLSCPVAAVELTVVKYWEVDI